MMILMQLPSCFYSNEIFYPNHLIFNISPLYLNSCNHFNCYFHCFWHCQCCHFLHVPAISNFFFGYSVFSVFSCQPKILSFRKEYTPHNLIIRYCSLVHNLKQWHSTLWAFPRCFLFFIYWVVNLTNETYLLPSLTLIISLLPFTPKMIFNVWVGLFALTWYVSISLCCPVKNNLSSLSLKALQWDHFLFLNWWLLPPFLSYTMLLWICDDPIYMFLSHFWRFTTFIPMSTELIWN